MIFVISLIQWRSHAGARALATSGHAAPVLIVALLIANWVLNGLEIEWCSITIRNTELRVSYPHHTPVFAEVTYILLRYMASEPTWEAVEFLNFLGEDAPRPGKV